MKLAFPTGRFQMSLMKYTAPEAYFEPIRISIVDVPLGSKYASEYLCCKTQRSQYEQNKITIAKYANVCELINSAVKHKDGFSSFRVSTFHVS